MIAKNNKGIVYMLIASLAFAIMGVFVKKLGRDFDTVEVVLFRNLVGVIIILLSFLKKPNQQTGGKRFLLLFRGFIGTISLFAFAYNIVHLSLGVAFTFFQTSTFFIAFFSYIFFEEKLNRNAWIGIIIGFVGIIFIFRPDIELFNLNNFLGLINGIFSAAAYMSVSELKKYYDTRVIVLSFMVWGTILPIISMTVGYFFYSPQFSLIFSKPIIPGWKNLFDIVCVGTAAFLGQIFATKAYGIEKAGIVSAISYSNVVFSVIFGVLMGDNFPDFLTFTGIFLIIVSGLVVTLNKV